MELTRGIKVPTDTFGVNKEASALLYRDKSESLFVCLFVFVCVNSDQTTGSTLVYVPPLAKIELYHYSVEGSVGRMQC
ncbi:hypothetical protein Y032_0009g734 [Ancylostoma ceylanicum]|uniref:Uncharacterized protein n=1 Tax=Ancylostoma ceylanicum TaxID=53326 RepID=A0A016VJ48_9BILA|nr:hypothetical protein Y032_0009g734 [Ancylostoma ceylanicum]